jgi:outer membrane protein
VHWSSSLKLAHFNEGNDMKALSLAVAAVLGVAALPAAAQDLSNLMVRVRGVNLDFANKSDAIPSVAPADAITVNNKTIPEVDFTYFFSPNLSAELILTVPQKQTVSIGGTPIGTFKHLPPVVTLQYRPMPGAAVQPYIGVGANLTYTMNVNMSALGKRVTLDAYSVGPALQAGLDIPIDKKWSINVDVKKIWIKSDVFLDGTKISHVKLDPIAVGVGVGYKF